MPDVPAPGDGAIAMNFDQGGKNLPAQRRRALVISSGRVPKKSPIASRYWPGPHRPSFLAIGIPLVPGTAHNTRARLVR